LAIRHIEASRTVAHLIERRAEIARYNTEPFDRIIVSLVRLGRINDACGYSERGKSLGVSDLISLGYRSEKGRQARDLPEYSALQIRATQLSQALTQGSQSHGKDSVGAGIWNRKYSTSQRQEFYRTAEKLVQLSDSALDSNDARPLETKPLGPGGIQQLGRETTAAFVFFRVTETATYAFVMTPGSLRVVRSDELKAAELDKAFGLRASSLPSKWWFGTNDFELFRIEMNRLLNRLGDALMKKVTSVLREQQEKEGVQSFNRVVLFPSRTLSILPLHACWWDGNNGVEHLLDSFPVSFAPSISIFRHCLESAHALNQETRFVGIFNPSPPGNLHFAAWEYSQMKTILNGWNYNLLHNEEATFDALNEMGGFDSNILHFSCHGHYQLDRPFQSYLSLAGGDRLGLQYILQEVRLNAANLVVLSACESGVVDPTDAADEHYGFPTAFVFAGAPTVWATFWSVDDVATALLTVRAYENLRNGEVDKSEALRKAQLWLRNAPAEELIDLLSRKAEGAHNDPSVDASISKGRQELAEGDPKRRPFCDPYYWAAFHTVGA
jgi:CHAT domain-containing protein